MRSGLSRRKLKPAYFAWLPMVVVALTFLSCCDDECDVIAIDNVAPAPPIGVFSVTGDETVSIYWWQNTERDLAGYSIYWKDSPAGNFRFLAETDQSYFIDTGLQNGVTYYYIVTAFDRAGNESLASEEIFDTPRPEGFGLTLFNVEKWHLGGDFRKSGYDFDMRRRVDGATNEEADIIFSYDGDIFLMYVPDYGTDIQDAGYIALEDVNWAPEKGWSQTGTVELIPGHSYVVWTRTNNFAKFQVLEEPGLENPTGDFVIIDWAYQESKGNPELVPPRRTASRTGTGAGH